MLKLRTKSVLSNQEIDVYSLVYLLMHFSAMTYISFNLLWQIHTKQKCQKYLIKYNDLQVPIY